MRWFYLALALVIAAGAGFFYYSAGELRDLRQFCDAIKIGAVDFKLRDMAYEAGFDVQMEPYAQMRIGLAHWHPSSASCRVFLNNSRAVDYRQWQEN